MKQSNAEIKLDPAKVAKAQADHEWIAATFAEAKGKPATEPTERKN